jgi:hypothetical protein
MFSQWHTPTPTSRTGDISGVTLLAISSPLDLHLPHLKATTLLLASCRSHCLPYGWFGGARTQVSTLLLRLCISTVRWANQTETFVIVSREISGRYVKTGHGHFLTFSHTQHSKSSFHCPFCIYCNWHRVVKLVKPINVAFYSWFYYAFSVTRLHSVDDRVTSE